MLHQDDWDLRPSDGTTSAVQPPVETPTVPGGFFSAAELRRLYAEGRNIMEWLRARTASDVNQPEAILASYDMQAGSYVEALRSPEKAAVHAEACTKLAGVLTELEADTVLEAGAGELTTLAGTIERMSPRPRGVAAFDISLSRIGVGRNYWFSRGLSDPVLFTGLLQAIPLPDNSVDTVFTSHAVEPNRGSEAAILRELYRVARRYVVLREPTWELGSAATRAHIETHRYIRDLPATATALGMDVVRHALWEVDPNPRNQAALIVIRKSGDQRDHPWPPTLASPFSKRPLRWVGDNLFSDEDGMVFPIPAGIACLLPQNGIFASHFERFATTVCHSQL